LLEQPLFSEQFVEVSAQADGWSMQKSYKVAAVYDVFVESSKGQQIRRSFDVPRQALMTLACRKVWYDSSGNCAAIAAAVMRYV